MEDVRGFEVNDPRVIMRMQPVKASTFIVDSYAGGNRYLLAPVENGEVGVDMVGESFVRAGDAVDRPTSEECCGRRTRRVRWVQHSRDGRHGYCDSEG